MSPLRIADDFLAIQVRPWQKAFRDMKPARLFGPRRAPRAAAVALAAGAISVALSGVGYAYWTTTGHGSGVATTGVATLKITSTAGPTQLWPGGGSANITVTLKNTGQGVISLQSLTPTATTTASGCTAGTYVKFTLVGSLPSTVGATDQTAAYTVALDPAAEAACAGATFTIDFAATGSVT